MKYNKHALVEVIERQQEDFVNADFEGTMVKNTDCFKRKSEKKHQSTERNKH